VRRLRARKGGRKHEEQKAIGKAILRRMKKTEQSLSSISTMYAILMLK
jgi:hypothetical protein